MTVTTAGYSEYIRTLLAEADQPATVVARQMGVTKGYVSQVLAGHCRPTPYFADGVVAALRLNEQQAIKLHRLCAAASGWRTR